MTGPAPDAVSFEPPDLPRLHRLLDDPDLDWLVERVRRRLELGQGLDDAVTRSGATEAERAAAARLLGRPARPGRSLTVRLPDVDRVLRDSGACPNGLAAAVIALRGPVTPRRETTVRLEAAWERAYAPLAGYVGGTTGRPAPPALADWYAGLRSSGLVPRLLGAPETAAGPLSDLARLLDRLPLSPPRSLASFAAEHLGDAHALDEGPLATLLLSALRALNGDMGGHTDADTAGHTDADTAGHTDADTAGHTDADMVRGPAGARAPASGAPARRELWATAGLLLDELSSQVLVLGLPGDRATGTGRALSALAAVGQPAVLTLRQLARDKPDFPACRSGPTVHVCENPAVLSAAADRLGVDCPPLVCLQGQPSTAAVRLLRELAARSWTVRYHGDFDWGGLRIANHLLRQVRWQPWRFGTSDLRAALAGFPVTTPLTGTPADADWDPGLRPALTSAGRRIEEELVIDHLLADLT